MKHYIPFAVFFSAAILSSPSFSQSQGPGNGSVFANEASIGTTSWTNPGNAQLSDDVYATAVLSSTSASSQYLKATGFGFSIPSTATINGIAVEFERKSSVAAVVTCSSLMLVKGGAIQGDDVGCMPFPTSDTYITRGNSTYLWGLTWTPADINGSDFGVVIAAEGDIVSGAATASIDHIRITVYYTTPNGISAVASSADELLMVHSDASGKINVYYQLCSPAKGQLSMINMVGETVFSKEVNAMEGNEWIDTGKIPAGIYFVKISSADCYQTKKIMIE